MNVEWSRIAGVSLGRAASHTDDRGTFVKLADDRLVVDQVCVSRNAAAGTLRGLHYQAAPHEERKLVWCSAGAVFDVVVDLRPDEPTYGSWASVLLTAEDPRMLRIPAGVAHGFQTIADDSEVTYLIQGAHAPGSARVLRWDDGHVNVAWPRPQPSVMSLADKEAPSWPPQS